MSNRRLTQLCKLSLHQSAYKKIIRMNPGRKDISRAPSCSMGIRKFDSVHFHGNCLSHPSFKARYDEATSTGRVINPANARIRLPNARERFWPLGSVANPRVDLPLQPRMQPDPTVSENAVKAHGARAKETALRPGKLFAALQTIAVSLCDRASTARDSSPLVRSMNRLCKSLAQAMPSIALVLRYPRCTTRKP
ncbi:hypothetical protein QFZ91_006127 [Paraburkholderia sp. JPY419]